MDFLDDNAEETQDTAPPRQPAFRHSYREAFCLWVLLLFWEAMTCPAISHSPLHSGTELLTVAGIVYGAVLLGRYHADPSAAFLFGMGCTIVFLPRYIFSGPAKRQFRHVPPNVPLTVAIWVGVAFGLGFACWLIAKLVARRPSVEIHPSSQSDEQVSDETPEKPTA